MVNESAMACWPELMRPRTVAAMLDLSEGTFRAMYPVLAADYGLKVYGVSGPKFRRDNVLGVAERLRAEGLDLAVDKSQGVVRVGNNVYPIGNGRSGKSGRGQKRKGGAVR